jgi:hypothetical protein
MSDGKDHASADEVANVVVAVGHVLSDVLCCQGYLVIIMDDHSGTIPAVENILQRPKAERERAAEVLRMWAKRIEQGATGRAAT